MERLAGVKEVEASFEHKTVWVRYHPQEVTVERLLATINALGYRAAVFPRPPRRGR